MNQYKSVDNCEIEIEVLWFEKSHFWLMVIWKWCDLYWLQSGTAHLGGVLCFVAYLARVYQTSISQKN